METMVMLLVAFLGAFAIAALLRRHDPPHLPMVYVQESPGNDIFSTLLLFVFICFIVMLVVGAQNR